MSTSLSAAQKQILEAIAAGAAVGEAEHMRLVILWQDGTRTPITVEDYGVLWDAGLIEFDRPRDRYLRKAVLTQAGRDALAGAGA